jgi:two-component system response regulator FixJ
VAGAAPNVVVVDDDDSMREAIGQLLEVAGYRHASYRSGEEFLQCVGERGADCVVCDLRLPGMTGFDVLARLRATPDAAPLVVITGHDGPGLREEAVRRGAAAYLPKPFRGTALLEAIRQVMTSEAPGAPGTR